MKAISEDGLDNISGILEKVNKSTDLDEVFEEDPSFAEASEGQGRSLIHEKKVIEGKPKAKRFFRGVSKHLN